ncbi:hypothetical protein ABZP36_008729 [Zizania latifolia]
MPGVVFNEGARVLGGRFELPWSKACYAHVGVEIALDFCKAGDVVADFTGTWPPIGRNVVFAARLPHAFALVPCAAARRRYSHERDGGEEA